MGLSPHVLDTMHGTPAVGMAVALYRTDGGQTQLVKRFALNADGRIPTARCMTTPACSVEPIASFLMSPRTVARVA